MKTFLLHCWQFTYRAGIFFVLFSVLLVIVLRWLPVGYTPLMFIRYVQCNEKAKIEHEWIAGSEIPNHLMLAVVSTEDQRFLTHHGFDLKEIEKAMDEAEEGDRHRGASSISQQTAKNVFLWPTSSFIRKGFEAWFTVLIELFWSKRHILEVYLNSIEFGNGIYGCEAAAQHFFHKSARQLTFAESARLAVVLPAPLRFNAGSPSGYLIKRQNWALIQMRNRGGILVFPGETEEHVKVKPKAKSKKKN
ncbi:MAG: monofunctional biosynthetic peptidoglycan transglycosylase [Bacteroidia bacterium]